MATRKTTEPQPLVDELPPVPDVPAPKSSEDVEFEVVFTPRVSGGELLWDWAIAFNTLAQHVGDYTAIKSDPLLHYFRSLSEAEYAARDMIHRIRNAIDLKLSLPDPITIKL